MPCAPVVQLGRIFGAGKKLGLVVVSCRDQISLASKGFGNYVTHCVGLQNSDMNSGSRSQFAAHCATRRNFDVTLKHGLILMFSDNNIMLVAYCVHCMIVSVFCVCQHVLLIV